MLSGFGLHDNKTYPFVICWRFYHSRDVGVIKTVCNLLQWITIFPTKRGNLRIGFTLVAVINNQEERLANFITANSIPLIQKQNPYEIWVGFCFTAIELIIRICDSKSVKDKKLWFAAGHCLWFVVIPPCPDWEWLLQIIWVVEGEQVEVPSSRHPNSSCWG